MTALELILSKIPELRKPAASRRKAAACLAEKLSFPFRRKSCWRARNQNCKESFSARLRATRGRRDIRSDGSAFLPLTPSCRAVLAWRSWGDCQN